GLEGALRKSVHEIETKINEFSDPEITATLLMMRRHEKDFMLRRDPKYGVEMKKRAAEFAQAVTNTVLPPEGKEELRQKPAGYQRDFFAWMESAQAVDREHKAASDAYAAIEPEIDAIRQEAIRITEASEAEDAASRTDTTTQMRITIVFIILGVSAAAYWLGRAMTRQLRGLAGSMKELAAGNFDVVLPGLDRNDEVGEIAGAVETFKLRAVEKARHEAEEEEAKRRAARAERTTEMQRLADTFDTAVGGIVET